MDKLSHGELNASLAEKLFGLDVRAVVDRYASGHGNIDEVEKFVIWKGEGYEDVPDYLTWQGMGEVIEAMAKRGWYYDLCDTRADRVPRAMFWSPKWSGWIATDANLHRAVALAAMSALEQEVE